MKNINLLFLLCLFISIHCQGQFMKSNNMVIGLCFISGYQIDPNKMNTTGESNLVKYELQSPDTSGKYKL